MNIHLSSLQTASLRSRDIVALRARLSPDEAAKADRYRRPQDQVLSIAARGRPIDSRRVKGWSINWRRTKPMLFCADGSDASTT